MTSQSGKFAIAVMISVAGCMLAGAPITPAAAAGDPTAGKSVFQSQCSICHTVQPGRNLIGPTLFGVMGRTTGSVPGYNYSPSNKGANITWDAATLDRYLEAPRVVVPGTKMTYGGLKDAAKRADLIAYLATLK